jgi:ABC-type multidrug transport system ATPase subunit
MEENGSSYAVISDNLRKVYPGQDGNPDKLAVKGLSLALPQGECFGMLGPNGAGKTSFIHMVRSFIFYCGKINYIYFPSNKNRSKMNSMLYTVRLIKFSISH